MTSCKPAPPHEAAVAIDEAAGDDSGPVTPLGILEAMLFVGDRDNRPLTAARAAELMRGVEPGEIGGLIEELNRRYTRSGCPYFVAEDSDGYRITLRKPFHPLRTQFYGRMREARLSQAAIDVLAIVAYQQPLSAEQIGAVRGKPSGAVLSQLVHRGLLRIERQPGKRPTCSTSPPTAFCNSSACRPWPTCRRARNSIGSKCGHVGCGRAQRRPTRNTDNGGSSPTIAARRCPSTTP